MNPIKNWKLRRDWRLVTTVQATIRYTDIGLEERVYYYLYENGLGQRKCDHSSTHYATDRDRKRHAMYLSRIRPWLDGAYDPDIPTYDTIKQKEFKDALKGQKT